MDVSQCGPFVAGRKPGDVVRMKDRPAGKDASYEALLRVIKRGEKTG